MLPGPPRDVSISAETSLFSVRGTIAFSRPEDDGGTALLVGALQICFAKDIIDTASCNTTKVTLGDRSRNEATIYSLEPETKYHFTLAYRNAVGQLGPSVSLSYTTPSKREY